MYFLLSQVSYLKSIYYFPKVIEENKGLSKTLTPLLLWGLGVGYVISGMYVGWNLGLEQGGTLGLGIATFFSIIMYTAFSFSYTELACAIPKAGGAFDYAYRALGKDIAFVTGIAQIIEFVFAPPAIAIGIGTYGWSGAFAALPFAIWFFLGIEGVANVAEETINPQKDILKGFGWAILTLVILCILTFAAAVGVDGWESIVYKSPGVTSDSPLPLAMGHVVSSDNVLYKMLVGVGIFGLIASFHGLILASGRATFEFGRVGFAPKFLGEISPRFLTPANALVFNTLIGIAALLAGKTGEIITFSVLGALMLYIISMISILRLRKTEPELLRPFRVPFFPVTPVIALVIAVVSFVAMVWYNLILSGVFLAIIFTVYIIFKILKPTSTYHDH